MKTVAPSRPSTVPTDMLGLHRQTVELNPIFLPPFDHHYNSAIFEIQGDLYCVMRCHNNNPPDADKSFWHNAKRSQLWVAMLNETTLQPDWYKRLRIPLLNAEDPRVVYHEGKVYVFFTTCSPPPARSDHTFHVAIFDVAFELIEMHEINFNARMRVEKNWTFFVGPNGKWRCVYMINPWMIMEFDEHWEGTIRHQAVSDYEWYFGVMRGGTSPVEVDGQMFTWFHSVKHDPIANMRIYTGALLSFEKDGLHLPTGVSQWPIITPKLTDITWVPHARVCFPCGAVFNKETREWLVSYGYGDHTTRIDVLNHDELLGPALWRPVSNEQKYSFFDTMKTQHWGEY